MTNRVIFSYFASTLSFNLCSDAPNIASAKFFASLDERIEVSLRPGPKSKLQIPVSLFC